MGTNEKKQNIPEGIIKNPLLRGVLIVTGSLCLGLAIAGIVLPLLPTTPFLLLAAACYYKSSSRIYNWVMHNRFFGQYIRDYKEKKRIPIQIKAGTLILLWGTILLSAFCVVEQLWIKILLIGIAVGVTIHILMIHPKKR